MTPANDNAEQPIAADRVIEVRPSPDELNTILHRRFPGMGPAYGRQLDEAAKSTFNADFTKWLGLDGRWHSTQENYRQPKGKRRQPKENAKLASHLEEAEAATQTVRDGWMFTEAVACRWREYAPGVAKDALELVGKVIPATSGIRLLQFGAVEDAMIRKIDAKRFMARVANDNEPIHHRRNRPRLRRAA
jgi:hypothetical protein